MAEPVYGTCVVCGDQFRTKKSHLSRRKTCSQPCNSIRKSTIYSGENNPNFGNRGPKNPMFKNFERISNYGYKLIYKPEHPNARDSDGFIFEHRLVMSEHLGRPLLREEHVHHKDGDKLNNDISNLEIISLAEHTALHNKQKIIVRDNLGRITKVIKKAQ